MNVLLAVQYDYMIIVMEKGATQEQFKHVFDRTRETGYEVTG